MLSKIKWLLVGGVFILIGIIIGGYLFAGVQSRSFVALHKCEKTCLTASELKALLSSVGIQRSGGALLPVVLETDKTIVINDPEQLPSEKFHFVLVPKKDIRDVADVSEGDEPYLADIFYVIRDLVVENKLVKYKVLSNGPGYQSVNYLHFHLIAR